MDRHVTIGTAGHVDHGKTALVKALTGIDTDRLEEEKRRGITIDLGFAALDLPGEVRASLVDVPGHEDFVRNMVAGATGVDLALMVIAADEGVMPQTVEHLAILEMLGVRVGVVALAKTDLVEPEWLELVAADVTERLGRSPVSWEPPVPVSAVTGRGLDDLRAALARGVRRTVERDSQDLFRLPIDRVFSLPGAGTVVTGTAWSGSVALGDEVLVLPRGERARVRGVQVHGEARERSIPGRRTALALAGVDRDAAQRGSVVVTGDQWRAVDSLDVVISLLPQAPSLGQRSRIRLHVGTAEVMAQVTPAGLTIESGASGVARLRLDSPVVPRWGDRGVIRRYSPVTTIGGCVVIDPWPAPRPRRPTLPADLLASPVSVRVASIVRLSGGSGIRIADLAVRAGVAPARLKDGVELDQVARVGGRAFDQAVVAAARATVLDAISAHHRDHPLEPGIPREQLRQTVSDPLLADHAEQVLASQGVIVLGSSGARLATFTAELDPAQAADGRALRDALAGAGAEGRTVAELAGPASPDRIVELAEFFVRRGTVVRIGKDRYYDRAVLDIWTRTALMEIDRLGLGTPAQLRESLGLTRKYLIPLLEWLDSQGLTVRVGDARRVGPAAHPVSKQGA